MEDLNRAKAPPTPAQIDAERLAVTLQDNNYLETIGKWLAQEQENALRMMLASTGEQCEQAKGAYRAIQNINDRAKLVMTKRDAELRRNADILRAAQIKE